METAAGVRRVDASAGIVLTAGQLHGFAASGANRFVVVDVPGVRDCRLFERALREPAVHIDNAVRHHIAFIAERLARAPLPESLQAQWTALLIDALELPGADNTTADARFARAAGWISQHLHEAFDTADVAAAVGLSPAGLRALFHRRVGQPPRDWISAARIDRAARLLVTTDRPISDIALACGFGEQSALTRAFKRRHGEPPARWRRRRRDG
ncbi:MAG TPA: AraC family transcriptional regulator [Arenicellales bacterium]|nr:AraC family transcriptional regulator [Arenicellales bacterium]